MTNKILIENLDVNFFIKKKDIFIKKFHNILKIKKEYQNILDFGL